MLRGKTGQRRKSNDSYRWMGAAVSIRRRKKTTGKKIRAAVSGLRRRSGLGHTVLGGRSRGGCLLRTERRRYMGVAIARGRRREKRKEKEKEEKKRKIIIFWEEEDGRKNLGKIFGNLGFFFK